MALHVSYSGFNNTAEYQASGIPWVTSSVVNGLEHFAFKTVSRSVTVKNVSGSTLSVAFTENGLNTGHYFQLISGESLSEDLRVTDLWLSGSGNSVTVIAGLTGIDVRTIGFRMTGSIVPPNTASVFEGMG